LIPAGEVLEKVGYEEQEKQLSEFTIEVPAQEYGDGTKRTHLIIHTLNKSKAKNKTVLEILIKGAGYEYIPKQNWIIDHRGDIILPSELIERYGLLGNSLRCPICMDPKNWDVIFAHLQGDFQKGHKLSTDKTIKLFSEQFWNWTVYDGKFQK